MGGRVEMWAGIECSYNRVGDRYIDQVDRAGCYGRPGDIDRLAALGVTAIRVPVIWERYVALGADAWVWTDAVLSSLQCHGITPIVGLMHHGSGPPGTSLVADTLPEQFAGFARIVAERYPWVRCFTPVNEPLTTARFAGLYGHWYPHDASPRTFARALVTQVRAISAAMRAVRDVTPSALLVQTEDIGRTYATEPLRYQADFENERRWLTFDLLCGRVTGAHPMHAYLRWAGISARELEAIADSACPPDIIGINHYLTSERFLDDRVARYPAECHGGNHCHAYADVEAVRVRREGIAGPYTLLREVWERYGLPFAVTEAHLGCTREQQLRWLAEVWAAAVRLRGEHADIRAVTAWSAFGAFDWASLLTRVDGVYEPGLFDARAPVPRKTALATMVRALAMGDDAHHPVAAGPGWWHGDRRLTYPAVSARATDERSTSPGTPVRSTTPARPIVIVGARGTLGRAFARACEARGLAFVALGRDALDITDEDSCAATLAALGAWSVVNCAGFVRVDDAERERGACHASNTTGAAVLARVCGAAGVKLISFSSDLVFDGRKRSPYVESDRVAPLCEYGRSKALAEVTVLDACPSAMVVRTAAFFGDDDANFVTAALRALAMAEPFVATDDVVVSPTYVPDLVETVLDLAIDGECGIWHLANAGALTWHALAAEAARVAGVRADTLVAAPLVERPVTARRPMYSALGSERSSIMPMLDNALARYARGRSWENDGRPARPVAAAADDDPNDSQMRSAMSGAVR